LSAKPLFREKADRLVEDKAFAVGRAHVAPARLHGGFDGLFGQFQATRTNFPGAPSYRNHAL
jgi:hypothetical protein